MGDDVKDRSMTKQLLIKATTYLKDKLIKLNHRISP